MSIHAVPTSYIKGIKRQCQVGPCIHGYVTGHRDSVCTDMCSTLYFFLDTEPPALSLTAAERKGNTLKVSGYFDRKLGLDSGPECLIYATFA